MDQNDLINALSMTHQPESPEDIFARQATDLIKKRIYDSTIGSFTRGIGGLADLTNRAMGGEDVSVDPTAGGRALEGMSWLGGLARPPEGASLGMFLGPKGLSRATGRSEANALRFMQEALGDLGEEQAFKKEGIFRGLAGTPRYEVPDVSSNLKRTGRNTFAFNNPWVDIHDIYKVPHIKATPPTKGKEGMAGGQLGNSINLYARPEDIEAGKNILGANPVGVAAHELMHRIQDVEGWPRGFNPGLAPYTQTFWDELSPGSNMANYIRSTRSADIPNKFNDTIAEALSRGDYNNPIMAAAGNTYKRAGGEVEAENVRGRLEYPDPNIYRLHPHITQGVPFEKQFDPAAEFNKMNFELPGYESNAVLGPATEGRWSSPRSRLYEHEILDSKTGEPIGIMNTSIHAGNPQRLHVDWIGSSKDDSLSGIRAAANSLGPREVMELLRSVREHYPDVNEITGYRVSGARSGRPEDVSISLKPGTLTKTDIQKAWQEGNIPAIVRGLGNQ